MGTEYNSRFSGQFLKLNPIPVGSNPIGVCCYPDGTSRGTQRSGCTGYFSDDTTFVCPDPSEVGICCSCSEVSDQSTFDPKTNDGIETGINKCNCEQKRGQWRAGTVIPTTLKDIKRACVNVFGIDVRYPKACCYSEENGDGTFTTVCEDVCTEADCAAKGSPNTNKTFFSGGRRCFVETTAGEPASTECTPEETIPESQLLAECTTGVDCFANSSAGNCCTRNYTTETTDCATTTQETCPGWWTSSAFGLFSCDSGYCDAIQFPKDGIIPQPPVETLSDLQSSTNILKKLPQPGEIYQGGIYVGIFNTPASAAPSRVYGNPLTGEGQEYTARYDPFGSKYKRWILIVHPEDYGVLPFMGTQDSDEIIETSYYDGFFNTYGNGLQYYGPNSQTFSDIRKKNINGFIDWYIPSQDECAYISKNINYDFYIPNGFSRFTGDTYYMTSTVFFNRNSNSVNTLTQQNVNNNYFVYGHHFGKPTVGRTTIMSRHTSTNIRLCRRIYLQD